MSISCDDNHYTTGTSKIGTETNPNAVNQKINRLSSCKKIFEESKGNCDDGLKDCGFQGRLEYLTPMDLTSRVKSNNGGTRTLIKVGEIINNSSHAKRRERIEIEK